MSELGKVSVETKGIQGPPKEVNAPPRNLTFG
jgi:hypothetical protein